MCSIWPDVGATDRKPEVPAEGRKMSAPDQGQNYDCQDTISMTMCMSRSYMKSTVICIHVIIQWCHGAAPVFFGCDAASN